MTINYPFNYTNSEVIVDTQWLVNYLNDPKLRLIEIDFLMSPLSERKNNSNKSN